MFNTMIEVPFNSQLVMFLIESPSASVALKYSVRFWLVSFLVTSVVFNTIESMTGARLFLMIC